MCLEWEDSEKTMERYAVSEESKDHSKESFANHEKNFRFYSE